MIDLIRGLLDRPLDPRLARAIVVLAITITFGFATLVTFGVIAGSLPSEVEHEGPAAGRPSAPPAASVDAPAERSDESASGLSPTRTRSDQDPQDRPGSKDYRRARAAMREHRALQHLPFREGGVAIVIAGADRGRAVVRVTGATVAAAKRGWHAFLVRFRDDGHAYQPRFASRQKVGPAEPASPPKAKERGSPRGNPNGARSVR